MIDKPNASLSLDLDNKWSYLRTHGDPDWESFPTYFDLVVPRILQFLEERNLNITFFVVGQDADLERNHVALASIADDGHEIGNHSYNHEPWLHLYTPRELDREFAKSEAAIERVTGQRTVGFRGPGFSLSDEVLRTLVRRRYEYDCTTFPTFLGPLARTYYFFKSQLSKEQREERKELFGSWRAGLQSNLPFEWEIEGEQLLEIPVTTMPIFKVPIHATYVMYLATFSRSLARLYFWSALRLCRLTGVQPSILLHPLDFMGREDDGDLLFFPGMNQSAQSKIELLSDCLAMMARQYNIVTMREHATAQRGCSMQHRGVECAPAGVARARPL